MTFRPTDTPAGYGRSVSLWIRNLYVYNKELADRVVNQVGVLTVGERGPGHVRILLSDLDEATRNELLAELPFLAKMGAPNALKESQKMDEIITSEAIREAKVKADNDAGLARLTWWGRSGLLEGTENNAEQIKNWLEQHVKGYLSVGNIDAAISILGPKGTNVLTWRKAEPVVAPPPAPPVEVLIKLSDGSTQLPLDKPVPRSATLAQAKDYLSRSRTKNPYIRTGFASKF